MVPNLPPLTPNFQRVYDALIDELSPMTMAEYSRPAGHCTLRELQAHGNGRAVALLAVFAGLPPDPETVASVMFAAGGHHRSVMDIPVQELTAVDTTPVVVGVATVSTSDALAAAHRDVERCGCRIRVDYDPAGRIIGGSARPGHECGRANFEEVNHA